MRGHDVVCVHDREDLRAASDTRLFEEMQVEARAILTNDTRGFDPLLQSAAQLQRDHFGVIFTSDRSLPRSKSTIGEYVRRLDALLRSHPADDAFVNQVVWLT